VKKIPKSLVFIGIVFLIGSAVFLVGKIQSTFVTPNLKEYLETKGVLFQEMQSFSINKIKTTQVLDLKVTKISAKHENIIARIELVENMEEREAQLYTEDKKVSIESIFLSEPAHYPGIITRNVECPDEFHPISGTKDGVSYYILYASERFSYGVCSLSEVKYKSLIGFLYCPQNDVFLEMKLFFPPEIFVESRDLGLLHSLRCE